MLDTAAKYDLKIMIPYFFIWYVFTIFSSGTAAPMGIFLPCIIIGCSIGHIYGSIATQLFPDDTNIHP